MATNAANTQTLYGDDRISIHPGSYHANDVLDNPRSCRAKACPGESGHLDKRADTHMKQMRQQKTCQHHAVQCCGMELPVPAPSPHPAGRAQALQPAEPHEQGARISTVTLSKATDLSTALLPCGWAAWRAWGAWQDFDQGLLYWAMLSHTFMIALNMLATSTQVLTTVFDSWCTSFIVENNALGLVQ